MHFLPASRPLSLRAPCAVGSEGKSCPGTSTGRWASWERAGLCSVGSGRDGPVCPRPLPSGPDLPGPSWNRLWSRLAAGPGPRLRNRSGEVTSLSSVGLRGFLAKCTSVTLLVVRFLTPRPVARSSHFCPGCGQGRWSRGRVAWVPSSVAQSQCPAGSPSSPSPHPGVRDQEGAGFCMWQPLGPAGWYLRIAGLIPAGRAWKAPRVGQGGALCSRTGHPWLPPQLLQLAKRPCFWETGREGGGLSASDGGGGCGSAKGGPRGTGTNPASCPPLSGGSSHRPPLPRRSRLGRSRSSPRRLPAPLLPATTAAVTSHPSATSPRRPRP